MSYKAFRSDFENPHQNAVVGSGIGGNIAYAYREGFRQACQALLAAAATESYWDPRTGTHELVYVDALVYPICFSARHFIELFLKDSTRAAHAMGPGAKDIGINAIHDLGALWIAFEAAIQRDERLLHAGLPLKGLIQEFADIDNTGATFRYAESLEEQLHLSDLEHINLDILAKKLFAMFEQTEEFEAVIEVLYTEYGQGTYTGKVHRGNLEAIARRLPQYAEWSTELQSVKEELCKEFRLSSRDFGKALNTIKAHREFSNIVGIEKPLEGLPVDVFERLKRVEADEASVDELTRDEWLRLDAVLEVGRGLSYSEGYDFYLERVSSPDYEGPYDPAHIVRGAFAQNGRLRNGLCRLGQPTLLKALEAAIPHLAAPPPVPRRHTQEEISEIVEGAMRSLRKMNGSGPQSPLEDEPSEA